MTTLPETPLERVRGPREVYLKRQDLLPHGGGNKVPRFLYALSQRQGERRVAAFSDYGCHSFTVLAAMAQDPALGIDALELWERSVGPNPYRRALAKRYTETPGVHVRRGSTVGLFLRYVFHGLFSRRGTFRMGIGGTVAGSASSYEPGVQACVRQLADAGVQGPAVHVLSLASGDTAKAVLEALRRAGRAEDHVVGVIGGPLIGHIGLKLRRPRGLHLVKPLGHDWASYVEGARAVHERTGVWLDPGHTYPAWCALEALPAVVADLPAVLWVTCPRIEAPPFDDESK